MACETRELTCINCPLGCLMTAQLVDGFVTSVTGNGCARGEAYAREELTDPTRTLTTTVSIEDAACPMLPVRTARPIPKGKIDDAMACLATVSERAPVRLGDVVLADVAGTGVDVVASRSLPRI